MRKTSELSSLTLATLLAISTLMVLAPISVKASPLTLEVINPLDGTHDFNFTSDTTNVGDTFVVNITVVDVTDLSTWQIKLTWDGSLLDYVSISLPADHVFSQIDPPRSMLQPTPFIEPGSVTWGCAYTNDPYWTFNGTGTCCQITLRITQGVGHRIPEVNCILAFAGIISETFLLDGSYNDIPFTSVNGFYDYKYVPGERVIRIIDAVTGSNSITLGSPTEPVPPEGYPFTVNVTLDGLTPDLYTYQIAVSFDKTKINCIAAWVPKDDPNFVFYGIGGLGVGEIRNDLGYVYRGWTTGYTENVVTVSKGIFCQINFTATETGTSTLNIIPTQDIYWVSTDDSFLWYNDMTEIPFISQSFSVTVIVIASIHDLAVTSVLPSKTVVGQGYSMFINVTVENQGTVAENFNVTVYANTTAIQIQNVTLESGASLNITFTWNTTGFAKGNYTIKACAWPVQGETDTEDNTLTDGWVYVGVPCDVTGPIQGVPDGVCNMRDIGYICNHFGTTPSSPNWDPNCDVTGPGGVPDGIVNMRDIGEACRNFGNTDP